MTRSCVRGLIVVLGATGLLLNGYRTSLAATGHDGTTMKSSALLRLGFDAAQPDLLQSLTLGVIVVKAPPQGPQAVAKLWHSAGTQQPATFFVGDKLYLLSTGPILDQPDEVAVQTLQRLGQEFVLQVRYTDSRSAGTPLRRNVPWLPVAEIALPSGLPPGEYKVSASWQAVESLPAGKLLGAPRTVKRFMFVVVP